MYKIILILMLFISFSYAQEASKGIIEDDSYSQVIIFKEFHDPGWILSADNKKYYFYYEGFTYENISTWHSGRELIFSYTAKRGVTLYDKKSDTYATVETQRKHPIERIVDTCLDVRTTTTGIASCYKEEYRNWDKEMNRRYHELKNSYPAEEFKTIQNMQRQWLKYRDLRIKTNILAHQHEQGTITIIEQAVRMVSIVSSQALYLVSIPDYKKEEF